ncbi:MAG: OmpA family protein [Planctomycetes bacterium]|nr:OmpA family protein [Planctomycetota bacterium]
MRGLTVAALVGIALSLAGCSAITLKRQVEDLKRENEDLRARNYQIERDTEIARRLAEQARDEVARARIEPATSPEGDAGEAPATTAAAPGEGTSPVPSIPEAEVAREGRGIRIVLSDGILFATGSTTLSTQGKQALARVATVIRSEYPDRTVRVDGHTDSVPVTKNKATWPTNWELAAARACAVVRYLIDRGIDGRRIYAASFGPQAPKATNGTPEGRSKNRRVEILVTDAES